MDSFNYPTNGLFFLGRSKRSARHLLQITGAGQGFSSAAAPGDFSIGRGAGKSSGGSSEALESGESGRITPNFGTNKVFSPQTSSSFSSSGNSLENPGEFNNSSLSAAFPPLSLQLHFLSPSILTELRDYSLSLWQNTEISYACSIFLEFSLYRQNFLGKSRKFEGNWNSSSFHEKSRQLRQILLTHSVLIGFSPISLGNSPFPPLWSLSNKKQHEENSFSGRKSSFTAASTALGIPSLADERFLRRFQFFGTRNPSLWLSGANSLEIPPYPILLAQIPIPELENPHYHANHRQYEENSSSSSSFHAFLSSLSELSIPFPDFHSFPPLLGVLEYEFQQLFQIPRLEINEFLLKHREKSFPTPLLESSSFSCSHRFCPFSSERKQYFSPYIGKILVFLSLLDGEKPCSCKEPVFSPGKSFQSSKIRSSQTRNSEEEKKPRISSNSPPSAISSPPQQPAGERLEKQKSISSLSSSSLIHGSGEISSNQPNPPALTSFGTFSPPPVRVSGLQLHSRTRSGLELQRNNTEGNGNPLAAPASLGPLKRVPTVPGLLDSPEIPENSPLKPPVARSKSAFPAIKSMDSVNSEGKSSFLGESTYSYLHYYSSLGNSPFSSFSSWPALHGHYSLEKIPLSLRYSYYSRFLSLGLRKFSLFFLQYSSSSLPEKEFSHWKILSSDFLWLFHRALRGKFYFHQHEQNRFSQIEIIEKSRIFPQFSLETLEILWRAEFSHQFLHYQKRLYDFLLNSLWFSSFGIEKIEKPRLSYKKNKSSYYSLELKSLPIGFMAPRHGIQALLTTGQKISPLLTIFIDFLIPELEFLLCLEESLYIQWWPICFSIVFQSFWEFLCHSSSLYPVCSINRQGARQLQYEWNWIQLWILGNPENFRRPQDDSWEKLLKILFSSSIFPLFHGFLSIFHCPEDYTGNFSSSQGQGNFDDSSSAQVIRANKKEKRGKVKKNAVLPVWIEKTGEKTGGGGGVAGGLGGTGGGAGGIEAIENEFLGISPSPNNISRSLMTPSIFGIEFPSSFSPSISLPVCHLSPSLIRSALALLSNRYMKEYEKSIGEQNHQIEEKKKKK